jgi:hypothetical protein
MRAVLPGLQDRQNLAAVLDQPSDFYSGGGTRTHNFEVNSFALCQLSYPGPSLCYPGGCLASASAGTNTIPSSTSA